MTGVRSRRGGGAAPGDPPWPSERCVEGANFDWGTLVAGKDREVERPCESRGATEAQLDATIGIHPNVAEESFCLRTPTV